MRRTRPIGGANVGPNRPIAGKAVGLVEQQRTAFGNGAETRMVGEDRVRARVLMSPVGTIAKAQIDKKRKPLPDLPIVLTDFKVNPFFGSLSYPDQNWDVAVAFFPTNDSSFEDYKRGVYCVSEDYGFFDTGGGVCDYAGVDLELRGPRWYMEDPKVIYEVPGRAQGFSKIGGLVSIGCFMETQLGGQWLLTDTPSVGHDYEENGQYVMHSLWGIEFTATTSAGSSRNRAWLHVKRTYTNPVEAFYDITPPPTSRVPVLGDNSNCTYNYHGTGPNYDFSHRVSVSYSGRGETTLLPNSGAFFAQSLEVGPGDQIRPLRFERADGSLPNSGVFSIGPMLYQMDFVGFRLISKENWEKWLEIQPPWSGSPTWDPLVWYDHVGDWFAKSGYPLDYETSPAHPDFHSATAIRDKVWTWPVIEEAATGSYTFPKNAFDIMVRITPIGVKT